MDETASGRPATIPSVMVSSKGLKCCLWHGLGLLADSFWLELLRLRARVGLSLWKKSGVWRMDAMARSKLRFRCFWDQGVFFS